MTEGKKTSSLNYRILSALVLIPVTLGLIYVGGMSFVVAVGIAAALILREWVRMAKLGDKVVRDCVLGVLYVLIACGSFIDLRLRHGETGLFLVTVLLLCVWGSDIGAYILGKTIGGPKMAPSISPNKTWAGLAGAILFPAFILAGLIAWQKMGNEAIICAFIAGIFFGLIGQAGDLLISKFKRRVGVKDTGTMIPGHGGILDRADSLMLVSPVFLLAYVLWV